MFYLGDGVAVSIPLSGSFGRLIPAGSFGIITGNKDNKPDIMGGSYEVYFPEYSVSRVLTQSNLKTLKDWLEFCGTSVETPAPRFKSSPSACRTTLESKSPELHRAEMLDSYMLAIAECGGSAASFVSKIETMTVKEMIDGLAQNGVRFTTDRKGVPKT